MLDVKFIILFVSIALASAAREETEWKIILGESVPERVFPFFAALYVNGPSNFLCGAVQISNRDFLTAAHCVYFVRSAHDGFERIIPRVDIYSRNGVSTKTTNVYVHEAYLGGNCPRDNDIAILRTCENVLGRVARLPPTETFKNTLPINTRLLAIGHGVTERGSPSNQLLQTNISVPQNCSAYPWCDVGGDFCALAYDTSKCLSVDAHDADLNMKCPDTCQGDSGGPLFLPGNDTEDAIVLGLTSRGNGCGKLFSVSYQKPMPSVYTDVSLHLDWIRETTRAGGKLDKITTCGSARLCTLFFLVMFILFFY